MQPLKNNKTLLGDFSSKIYFNIIKGIESLSQTLNF